LEEECQGMIQKMSEDEVLKYLKEKYGVPNLVPESWSLEQQGKVMI
jgi:hypothetical protein